MIAQELSPINVSGLNTCQLIYMLSKKFELILFLVNLEWILCNSLLLYVEIELQKFK